MKTAGSIVHASFAALLIAAPCLAQTNNATQSLLVQGVTTDGHTRIVATQFAADGSVFLLSNTASSISIKHLDGTLTSVLASATLGAPGDAAVAMAMDPAGNLLIAGTSTSGQLTGNGSFPQPGGSGLNSFVASYSPTLTENWLSFLGANQTAVTAVAVTTDAVYVTGVTYSTAFPVTTSGIQQAPANGSFGNGFVERFSTTGSLIAATYLTGANGSLSPAAVAADSADDVFVAGSTTSAALPTIAALQPNVIDNPSGFLLRLTPQLSGFTFSTYIAGAGVTSLALDGTSNTLLLSGELDPAAFPWTVVPGPLAAVKYQSFARISLDGQTVVAAGPVMPGTATSVSSDAVGGLWLTGSADVYLFPGELQPYTPVGDGYAIHLSSMHVVDQSLRLGAQAVALQAPSTFITTVTPASASGSHVLVATTLDLNQAGTLSTALPRRPTPALNGTLTDAIAGCGSQGCSVSAGVVTLASTAVQPSLALSTDALPQLTLFNTGSADVTGVTIAVSGYTATDDCGTTITASSHCDVLLTGTGPGSITVSSPAGSVTYPLAASNAGASSAIVVSQSAVHFGRITANEPGTATVTLTNLSSASAEFPLVRSGQTTPTAALTLTTDCASVGSGYVLQAAASCHVHLTATALSDGLFRTFFNLGGTSVLMDGVAGASALGLSSRQLNFGTSVQGTTPAETLYLWLSNNSATVLPHEVVSAASGDSFRLTDNCPSSLEPAATCAITVNYQPTTTPSTDAEEIVVDGTVVQLVGTRLSPALASGLATDPSLSVTPAVLDFTNPVIVTEASSAQSVTLLNTGSTPVPVQIEATGDFAVTSPCPAILGPGAGCVLSVTFAPSAPGERPGLITISTTSSFAPKTVSLKGTALDLLAPDNSALSLGTTDINEPVVRWFQVQQAFPSLSVTSSSAAFTVALAPNTGNGPPTQPIATFAQSATAYCAGCWLGVAFVSASAGSQSGTLKLSSASGGSPYVVTASATAQPLAGVLIEPATATFGTVAVQSASAPQRLTVANLTSASVNVTGVTTSGDFVLVQNDADVPGCTGSLAPAKSCYVSVQFAPSMTGSRSGMFTVSTSTGAVTASLSGFGVSDPGLAVTPSELHFTVTSGTDLTVTLRNTSGHDEDVGNITAGNAAFTANTSCPRTLAASAACTVTVHFTPQAAEIDAALVVPFSQTLNGQTVVAQVNIPLRGLYTSANVGLVVLPESVNLGSSGTGTVGSRRIFTVTNLAAEALTMNFDVPREFSLAAPADCPVLTPGASCDLAVQIQPATNGPLTGTLHAYGIGKSGASADNVGYLLGYGDAPGTLTLSGPELVPNSALNFGQVRSGQSSTRMLAATNAGSQPVTVGRIYTEPPFYSTSTCAAALKPGDSCSVTLTYAPVDQVASASSARADSGVLTIQSDTATSPNTIQLTGSVTSVVVAGGSSAGVLNAYRLSTSSVTFPPTVLGTVAAPQTVTLTNSGTATITIVALHVSQEFTVTSNCTTIAAGASCALTVGFSPSMPSTSMTRTGTLSLLTSASDSLDFITLYGTTDTSPLTVSTSALDFGQVVVGANLTLPLGLTNTSTSTITLGSPTASGDYSAALGSCPAALVAGASCSLAVSFQPTVAGVRSGTLAIPSSATPSPLTVALTGTGVQSSLSVSPGSLNFGPIALGARSQLAVVIYNAGSTSATGITTAISGTGSTDFAVVVPCSSSSLAPGQGCTLTVVFTPSVTGPRSASLVVTSSDPASPFNVQLNGSGIAAGSFVLSTVTGSTASMTTSGGVPANFPLTLAAVNGYTGSVALTCAAVIPAAYATCSVSPSALSLNGSSLGANATITTLSAHQNGGGIVRSSLLIPACLLAFLRRRRGWLCSVATLAVFLMSLGGCGGGYSVNNLQYTPPGAYTYQVTASSINGTVQSSTVTLNVTVR